MDSLYTFILDYRGGTYIGQNSADSLLGACQKWAAELRATEIYHLGDSGKKDLQKGVADEQPTPIQGVQNVWCLSVIARGKLAMINIVKTERPK